MTFNFTLITHIITAYTISSVDLTFHSHIIITDIVLNNNYN